MSDLARRYGVSPQQIIQEFEELGIYYVSPRNLVSPSAERFYKETYGAAFEAAERERIAALAPKPRAKQVSRRGSAWEGHGFDEVGERMWREAGLLESEVALALWLLEQGILPEILANVRIDGIRAVERLRGGMDSRVVVAKQILELRGLSPAS